MKSFKSDRDWTTKQVLYLRLWGFLIVVLVFGRNVEFGVVIMVKSRNNRLFFFYAFAKSEITEKTVKLIIYVEFYEFISE